MCSLKLLMMDGKTYETCRVIFNKLEKTAHLVGFTIEIYHDAWSHERQIESTFGYTVYMLACSQRTCLTYTRCCMYTLELLMMDGKTVRNM